MKKLTFIFGMAVILMISACGGSSNNDAKQDNNSENQVVYNSDDGILQCTLPSDWKANGEGPNGMKMYGSIYKWSSGDIYKDIKHDYGFAPIDEVHQIEVDGLPALTIKEKFQQNEEKIKRTWLVYNGSDIIEIVVQAPTANWDDDIANSIISAVKINKRAENVELPKEVAKEKKSKLVKPESFPEEYFNSIEDVFSSEQLLSDSGIDNTIALLKEVQSMETANMEGLDEVKKTAMLDSLATNYGFKSFDAAVNDNLVPALLNASILTMTTGKESTKVGDYDFIKDFINQNRVSLADLKYTYDNWDKVKELELYTTINGK